jgi:hypothetical protein
MTMTTAQAAEKLETTPRELRKFLRSITPKDSQPGKGSRWNLEAKQVNGMRKQFNDWKAAQEARHAEAAEAETEE